VRILTTGEGLSNNMNFYFVTQSFANNHDMIIKIVIDEMRKVGLWVPTHQEEAAQILASNTGLKLAVALKIIQRARYEAQPIQDQAIEEQQRIADTFFRLGLLPKTIRVEDAVLKRDLRN
jgi:sulfonate transport system substrate-binding protein